MQIYNKLQILKRISGVRAKDCLTKPTRSYYESIHCLHSTSKKLYGTVSDVCVILNSQP